jgi:hypothetical protein
MWWYRECAEANKTVWCAEEREEAGMEQGKGKVGRKDEGAPAPCTDVWEGRNRAIVSPTDLCESVRMREEFWKGKEGERVSTHETEMKTKTRAPTPLLILPHLFLLLACSVASNWNNNPSSLRSRFPGLLQGWYLDDGNLAGDTVAVGAAVEAIDREGPEYGIHLNRQKTILWWPSLDPARLGDFPDGIQVCREAEVKMLGAPLSASAAYVSDFVEAKAVEVGRIIGSRATLNDPQSELLLLRGCLGVCKVTHIAGCTPPELAREGLGVFDGHLHDALRRIVVGEGPGFGPLQEEIAALPLSMGGLRVTRGADILPHAFLASIYQTHKLQDRILGSWEVPWVEAVHVAKDSLGRILPISTCRCWMTPYFPILSCSLSSALFCLTITGGPCSRCQLRRGWWRLFSLLEGRMPRLGCRPCLWLD